MRGARSRDRSLAPRRATSSRHNREPTRPACQRRRTPDAVEERAGMQERVGAALKEVQTGDERNIDVAYPDASEPDARQRVGDLRGLELALVAAVILVVASAEQMSADEAQESVPTRIL